MGLYDRFARLQPVFLAIILLFGVIEGCITAYLTSVNNGDNKWPDHSMRDRVKFLLFCGWWTVALSALYMIFFFWFPTSVVSSIMSNLVYVFVTWVFWLAGAASFTQAIGGGQRCSVSKLVYCGQNVAVEAFAWIEWIILCFFLGLMIAMTVATVMRGDRLSTPVAHSV